MLGFLMKIAVRHRKQQRKIEARTKELLEYESFWWGDHWTEDQQAAMDRRSLEEKIMAGQTIFLQDADQEFLAVSKRIAAIQAESRDGMIVNQDLYKSLLVKREELQENMIVAEQKHRVDCGKSMNTCAPEPCKPPSDLEIIKSRVGRSVDHAISTKGALMDIVSVLGGEIALKEYQSRVDSLSPEIPYSPHLVAGQSAGMLGEIMLDLHLQSQQASETSIALDILRELIK